MTIALRINFWLVFESPKCRKLSDIDWNVVPSFKSQVVKAFLQVFKIAF